MAAVALRHLQRTLRRAGFSCSSVQSGRLCAALSETPSRPSRVDSNLQPASRISAAEYSSGRSVGHNYGVDLQSYNKLISEINYRRRHYLSRDVYEDMLLDGVQPIRDTFYLLITGCTLSARLQDVLFFFDEMKAMGITPDVSMYNCVITACGRSEQIDRAFQIAEEMEVFGVQPKHRTFLALLRACAIAGRVEEAYGLVRRMAAYGLTLDAYCYAALITAHKNADPENEETIKKIFEILEQSKVPTKLDAMEVAATGEVEAGDDVDDPLVNFVVGGETRYKRGLINSRLVVHHAAMSAFQELGNSEAVKTVLRMIEREGHSLDADCIKQIIKCYISEGEVEKAYEQYDKFLELGRRPSLELYLILIDGALSHPSPANSAVAQKLLAELDQKGFFLNLKISSDLLGKTCYDKTRDVVVAGMIWDLCQKRGQKPSVGYIMGYYKALEKVGTPMDDPRMMELRSLLEKSRRFGKVSLSSPTAAKAAPASQIFQRVKEAASESSEQVVAAAAPEVGEEPRVQIEDASETDTTQAMQQ
ncbi:hypothetical protein R1flu_023560 [Riccia fluitans]|uniref:PROP1-like PPR domain-containing protein n=1 Tax=Riccia fluitans TaxID=41844 RepID=A0ABD1XT66_9MARC